MNYKSFILDRKEGIAFISINRPEKANSISSLLIEEFIDFFSKNPLENGTRVAVIRGVGKKYFCAGADIGELNQKTISDQREGFLKFNLFYESVRKSQMISIATVNGLALGGGCGLAAVCDIAIASKTAKFGLPEINLGLAPMIVLLPVMRSIGIKMAFLLASRGHLINAEEALKIGLISSLVEEESLDDEARKLASELAGKSGIILSLIKQGIQGAEEFNYPRAYEYLKELLTYAMLTEDSNEGIQAFKEKRRPVWKHQ
jgi:enoyl-CoA hydratase/carnithine racemase